jgi:molecular chaperone DnaJ
MGGGGPGRKASAASPRRSATSSATSSAAARAGAGRASVFRGADLRYNLEISLEQAARGTETKIRIPDHGDVRDLQGLGRQGRERIQDLRDLQGLGTVRISQGFFSIQQTCPTCHGTGKMVTDPCASCRGAGAPQEAQDARGKIPRGRRRGRPHPPVRRGRGGRERRPAGRPLRGDPPARHGVFQRDGDDLHCEMPISFSQAALGGEIDIPTLDGSAKIKVPPETQTGQTFRLRGKGIKGVRSSYPETSSARWWWKPRCASPTATASS